MSIMNDIGSNMRARECASSGNGLIDVHQIKSDQCQRQKSKGQPFGMTGVESPTFRLMEVIYWNALTAFEPAVQTSSLHRSSSRQAMTTWASHVLHHKLQL